MGNNLLLENERVKLQPDGTLVINKVTTENSGNYTCAIYNEHGKDEVQYSVTVQIPPAAPSVSVISKTKSTVQLQWKPSSHGGDAIKGYLLHYKRDVESWITKELRPEHGLYTLEGLMCGTTYQIYLEAFNVIGTGPPCDIITVATDGAELQAPTTGALIREGSTFVSVHLDSWPSTGCPIEHFQIEYKELKAKPRNEWIQAGTNVSPLQKKLVISGLSPATRYILRLHVESTAGNSVYEYRFSTLTVVGGTIAPEIMEDMNPVYIFYMDPLIFIPAVALLAVVIIASVIVCIFVKRRNGSIGEPSDHSLETSQMNTWIRNSRMMPPDYGYSYTSTMSSRRTTQDPSPYATTHMSQFYPDGSAGPSVHPPSEFTGSWKKRNPSPLVAVMPGTSVDVYPPEGILDLRSNDGYDPPPKTHMIRNPLTDEDRQ